MKKKLIQRINNFNYNKKLYDLTYLKNIRGGNEELIKDLIEIFIKTMPSACKEMVEASKQKDWKLVNKLAHKIKSNVYTLGIFSIKEDLEYVEKNAFKKQNTDAILSNAINVEKTVMLAAQELQQQLNTNFSFIRSEANSVIKK
ncbi:MAG: Hpt domain-containing protein [Chitinophagaceae bacterium]